MRKLRNILIPLLILLLLTGCGSDVQPETTLPPETSRPVETTLPPETAAPPETAPPETEPPQLRSGELPPEIMEADQFEIFREDKNDVCNRYVGSSNVINFSELGISIELPEELVGKVDVFLFQWTNIPEWNITIVNKQVLNAHLEHDDINSCWMDLMLMVELFQKTEREDSCYPDALNTDHRAFLDETDRYYIAYSTREMYGNLYGSNDMIYEQIDMYKVMDKEAYEALHDLVITPEMAEEMIIIHTRSDTPAE